MKKEFEIYFEIIKQKLVSTLIPIPSKNRVSPDLRLIPSATQTGWVPSYDGTQIYFEVHNPNPEASKNNPPLVFCYGLVCSMNQWRKQVEYFSQTHRVILFDYRGHHKSETPDSNDQIHISALAKDLAAVLNHLNVQDPVDVWGHSMGVSVALEFSVQEPQRVRSLILCCGSPTNPFANMFDISHLEKLMSLILSKYPEKAPLFESVWSLFLKEPRIAEWVSSVAGFNMKASDKKDVQVYVRAVSSVEAKVFFALLTDLSRGMTQNILAQVKAPSLVVAGADDHVTPVGVQKKLAQMITYAEYFEVPLGSHNVQLDFGDYVNLKALDFWNRKCAQKKVLRKSKK